MTDKDNSNNNVALVIYISPTAIIGCVASTTYFGENAYSVALKPYAKDSNELIYLTLIESLFITTLRLTACVMGGVLGATIENELDLVFFSKPVFYTLTKPNERVNLPSDIKVEKSNQQTDYSSDTKVEESNQQTGYVLYKGSAGSSMTIARDTIVKSTNGVTVTAHEITYIKAKGLFYAELGNDPEVISFDPDINRNIGNKVSAVENFDPTNDKISVKSASVKDIVINHTMIDHEDYTCIDFKGSVVCLSGDLDLTHSIIVE